MSAQFKKSRLKLLYLMQKGGRTKDAAFTKEVNSLLSSTDSDP